MALAIFSASYTPLQPYGFGDDRPFVVAKLSGGAEQRAAVLSRPLRTFRILLKKLATDREAIDAFFAARGVRIESFLWKDLKDYARTGVTLVPSPGDGATTAFSLPKTGTYAGDYPIDQAGTLLKVAGASVTRTVQTDARTLTAAVAPGASAITADYEYYRRVVLDQPYRWDERAYGHFWTELALREVPST